MHLITRRSAIGLAAGATLLRQGDRLGAQPADLLSGKIKLPFLGRVKPRKSIEISASPFSIGFELLDRQLFDPEKTYPHLAELGVKWARVQTGWARCEKVKVQYDFTWLDQVVDSLRKIGIQPWFNLGFGNRLYTPEAPHETAVGFPPVNSEEARQAWVRFVGKIAEHFRTRVKHWEIWNEPNITAFWRPGTAGPEQYFGLVKMTAPVIRKRVPGAVIVGGGLSGMPLEFVEGCLELGMAKHIDRLSYHPYRRVPEANYDTDVRTLRAMLARYRPGLAVWQGENGVRSHNAYWGIEWNEPNQAKWLLRRMLSDLRNEIELTSYYHTVDCPGYFIWDKQKSGWQMFAGVLRSAITPKPSYFAYQCLCALFDSQTRRADLSIAVEKIAKPEAGGAELDVPVVSTGSFVRNGHPVYAYWYPSNFERPFEPRQASLALWSGRAGTLADPVLVDPLSTRVYRIEGGKRTGQTLRATVPMMEYPMLITDRAVTGS